jgi:hypothetical protein
MPPGRSEEVPRKTMPLVRSRRRPLCGSENVNGDGGEAVAEWLGLWTGVEDEAGGEACADFVANNPGAP